MAELKQRHDADQILIYMQLMLERAHERQVAITREGFNQTWGADAVV